MIDTDGQRSEAQDELDVRTADGRILKGRSFGPGDGVPVLFIAGAGTGRSMRFGEPLLDGAGVRLLTMDRPGMAGSDEDPRRTLTSTVDDYRAFVDGVVGDATAVPVVANSQGSVFGLGAAVAGWASRLVLASPADELAHPPIQAMLPPDATQLAVLAGDDPDQAAQVLRSFTPEAMEQMVLAGAHESDREFYSEAAFASLYRRALAEGFANGGAGYVCDTLIAMRSWGLPLGGIRVPVAILFGADDRGHSPDLGATLAQRIPGAERRVIAGAGGSLLWTHAASVLASVMPSQRRRDRPR